MSPTARKAEETAEERIGLHNLRPAPGSRRPRKRVGRGEGSGTGKTSGRGQKGAGSRSGAKDRARFEGGQMPIHMRMRKLRGPHMKKSMPFEPFRTHTQPVNLLDLEARFDSGAEVTLEALNARGLATRKGIPVKVLAKGEITKPLTVHAHAFSAAARERIEAAGRNLRDTRVGGTRRMLATILSAFTVADIRKKLAFTAALLALYRLGAHIPAPGINTEAVKATPEELLERRDPQLAEHSSPAEASARIALFALGIMPYITASIIMQLLTVVVPSLEQLQRRARSARSGSRSTPAT